MYIKKLAIGVFALALLSGCSSKRNTLTYFDGIETSQVSVAVDTKEYLTKIIPDDELMITVTSSAPELTLMYNLPLTNPGVSSNGIVAATSIQQATYRVDSNGDIVMPELGQIHVQGLTIEQLTSKITDMVRQSVSDATVIVRLVNFKVNVTGEVNKPGVYDVSRERFSILDALSQAGDLTQYGQRNNVVLVREEDGKRVSHILDLTSPDILKSPYFYVKQNDYIYVQPNQVISDNSRYNQNNAFKLSVVSTIVSACSIVASLVIALTVK